MLRISVEQDHDGFSFVLEGRLVGPWVNELRTVWQELAENHPGVQLTADLCSLTAMDTDGQRLLEDLLQHGATLRCSDVMNQYLVEQMSIARGTVQEAYRPCRHFSEEDSRAQPRETKFAS